MQAGSSYIDTQVLTLVHHYLPSGSQFFAIFKAFKAIIDPSLLITLLGLSPKSVPLPKSQKDALAFSTLMIHMTISDLPPWLVPSSGTNKSENNHVHG